jgi:hypothetical protein
MELVRAPLLSGDGGVGLLHRLHVMRFLRFAATWLVATCASIGCGNNATTRDAAIDGVGDAVVDAIGVDAVDAGCFVVVPAPEQCLPPNSCYRQTTHDDCVLGEETCIFYPADSHCTFATCGDLPYDQCRAGDACRWNSYEHRCYPKTLPVTCYTGCM